MLAESFLQRYLQGSKNEEVSKATIAQLASLDYLSEKAPDIAESIIAELKDQRTSLKLIASENYSSAAVQLAMGNWLTDKYAEGVPDKRFYAGCANVDAIEAHAIESAKKLFGADHAYVQPHSGADANLVAFYAMLTARIVPSFLEKFGKKTVDELSAEEHELLRKQMNSQTLMGMSLNAGGHLTHGYRHNVSSKIFRSVGYEVNKDTLYLDYDHLKEQVLKEKPMVLIAGYSSYPRLLDFAKLREIADSVGAYLMVDMAHFAGLVAGGVFEGVNNPMPYADIVTTTTHKTLRGPRGGMVLCKSHLKEFVDKGCPMVLGGPLPHVMAAKAIAFDEALKPEFKVYAHQIVKNAKALAQGLIKRGVPLTTGGTDNHLMVAEVFGSFGLTGRQAEIALREAKITVNRNAIPYDKNGAWYTSGIRLGTPALTTRGMNEEDMDLIAELIVTLLSNTKPQVGSKAQVIINEQVLAEVKKALLELLNKYPLYPELMID
jgi:glycine hydroxymethyltransferase